MIVVKNRSKKEWVATISLMAAMFFNPFGFDVLFKKVMDWTGSYWITDAIFYCLSALCFTSYYLLKRSFDNETN